MGGTIINDVQVGQNTRINIQSRHWGRKRVPLAGTLSFTPKETSGVIPEFDNQWPVMVWHVFDSCDVKFEAPQADQTDLEAMIYDMNPSNTYFGFDDARKSYNVIWCNYYGKNLQYLYAAEYAELCQNHQSDTSVDLKSPLKRTYTFTGGRHLRIMAQQGKAPIGIQYTRFVNTPAFSTPDDVALSGSGNVNGVFPYAPQTFQNNGGPVQGTANFIQCLYNGVPFTNFTISGVNLTIGQNTAVGDVVEFWTVAAANVS